LKGHEIAAFLHEARYNTLRRVFDGSH
jgi:hypothetical protein